MITAKYYTRGVGIYPTMVAGTSRIPRGIVSLFDTKGHERVLVEPLIEAHAMYLHSIDAEPEEIIPAIELSDRDIEFITLRKEAIADMFCF